jgi:hypothetical protein
MADLQNYSVERGNASQAVVPTHVFSGQLVEGQSVLHDFTGANAIRWPTCLAQLPIEVQDEIAQQVATRVINAVAAQG